jgi:transcription-repair coupling factor (superfamily II helicase)
LQDLVSFARHLVTGDHAPVGGRIRTLGTVCPQAAPLLLPSLEAPGWLLVAPSADVARRLVADLAVFGADARYFPALESGPYEGVSPASDLVEARLAVLGALAAGEPVRIVTTARALAWRLPRPEALREARVRLAPGQQLPPHEVTARLVMLGFRPATAVTERGEFSRRGGILDVFPPHMEAPARLEWFGDEIDRIQAYDLGSQRATGDLKSLDLWPTRELVLPLERWGEVQSAIQQAGNRRFQQLMGGKKPNEAARLARKLQFTLEQFSQFKTFEGCEAYAPFMGADATLFDYLPTSHPVVWLDRKALWTGLTSWIAGLQKKADTAYANGDLPPLPHALHVGAEELERQLKAFAQLDWASGEPGTGPGAGFAAAPGFGNQMEALAREVETRIRDDVRIVVASAQPQRVVALLDEHGIRASYGGHLPRADFPLGGIWVVRESLNQGLRWDAGRLWILSDAELFGWQKRPGARAPKRTPYAGPTIAQMQELHVDDYVVHAKHGIGQFKGLTRLEVNGQEREYLIIQYQGDDRLYVPAEQLTTLHRYRGSHDHRPRVHKMGGAEWENVKKRVRKSVQDLAEDLLKLYATRASRSGFAYPPDSPWQAELEDAFPYTETPDQLRAIAEAKADLERDKPMDRLVCGDVGFGKTEVALRTIFKAAMAGKQVAFLAPTTLLAHQHFQTLRERFAPYPVRMRLLSRFKSAKEQKETVRGLTTGEVDIVVGTHRVLSQDIAFKDLGLLVIDEEHRFGVAHKERLKHLKSSVDVLTMSATPIPRTLYLALSGARDLSLISTPPMNRQPIKTHVSAFDPGTVRTAILHELDRGGQVFFLHNRVESIHQVAAKIQELVPQARVIVGHGQMNEHELEDVMLSFLDREYDVLVATTIIESGLDIPNANTMIIDDADRLGLAQLYQIRGRVGRSDARAVCYCFYSPGKELTQEGRERLEAIQQFTALGSGYQIALRDMEIRGVGNILGAEQHGQMISVGFDLYMQLLEEAVAELQGQGVPESQTPTVVDVAVAAHLPDEWFADSSFKMEQYKRLASVVSERELEMLGAEWRDRYGPPPPAVRNLLRIVALRIRATPLGIAAIRGDGKLLRVQTQVTRARWADLALKGVHVSRWKWGEQELSLDRDRIGGDDMLSAAEKLVGAMQGEPGADLLVS